jgi:colicin import membrane protein
MPSASDRLDFGPPTGKGSVRAFALALLVHALLIAALTWGVNWKRSDLSTSYEAEIWSAVPQQVAPRLVETPPEAVTPPPPAPVPPEPEKTEKPEVKAPPPPPPPNVDIALEQEKKRKLRRETEALVKNEKEKRVREEAKAQTRLKEAEEAKKLLAKKKLQEQQAVTKLAEANAQKIRKENIDRLNKLIAVVPPRMGPPSSKSSATDTVTQSRGSPGSKMEGFDLSRDPVANVELRRIPNGELVERVTPSKNR